MQSLYTLTDTSRSKRDTEQEGREYHFVKKDGMQKEIDKGRVNAQSDRRKTHVQVVTWSGASTTTICMVPACKACATSFELDVFVCSTVVRRRPNISTTR